MLIFSADQNKTRSLTSSGVLMEPLIPRTSPDIHRGTATSIIGVTMLEKPRGFGSMGCSTVGQSFH